MLFRSDANISTPNKQIVDIIEGLIRDSDGGLPVLINRNPTIAIGGVLCMRCVGIAKGFTMGTCLEVLEGLAADYDGD